MRKYSRMTQGHSFRHLFTLDKDPLDENTTEEDLTALMHPSKFSSNWSRVLLQKTFLMKCATDGRKFGWVDVHTHGSESDVWMDTGKSSCDYLYRRWPFSEFYRRSIIEHSLLADFDEVFDVCSSAGVAGFPAETNNQSRQHCALATLKYRRNACRRQGT